MYLTLEGQIGSGKSTFAKAWVEQHAEYTLLEEPLPRALLSAFYNDGAEYGFPFQMVMLTYRLVQAAHGHMAQPCVVDRGLLGDMSFALASRRLGLTSRGKFDIYLETMKELRTANSAPRQLLYLHKSTSDCKQRIASRGRASEQGIDVAYLQCVEDAHQDLLLAWCLTDWLDECLGPCPEIKVCLDADGLSPGPAAYEQLPVAVVVASERGVAWNAGVDRAGIWRAMASGQPVRVKVDRENILKA